MREFGACITPQIERVCKDRLGQASETWEGFGLSERDFDAIRARARQGVVKAYIGQTSPSKKAVVL